MNKICAQLKKDIIESADGILDPYNEPFKPGDLGLKANQYGSFSDHCITNTTISSKWCGCGTLKCVNKRPYKYILNR